MKTRMMGDDEDRDEDRDEDEGWRCGCPDIFVSIFVSILVGLIFVSILVPIFVGVEGQVWSDSGRIGSGPCTLGPCTLRQPHPPGTRLGDTGLLPLSTSFTTGTRPVGSINACRSRSPISTAPEQLHRINRHALRAALWAWAAIMGHVQIRNDTCRQRVSLLV
jgi:hypothetical protein